LAVLGCDDGSASKAATPPATNGLPDYTILAKNQYGSGQTSGKAGYYVTIVLFGEERETAVSRTCYNAATLGSVLSTECR